MRVGMETLECCCGSRSLCICEVVGRSAACSGRARWITFQVSKKKTVATHASLIKALYTDGRSCLRGLTRVGPLKPLSYPNETDEATAVLLLSPNCQVLRYVPRRGALECSLWTTYSSHITGTASPHNTHAHLTTVTIPPAPGHCEHYLPTLPRSTSGV